jgi:hypothetical protein
MTEALGADKGERAAGRLGYRSGYYGRMLITRVCVFEVHNHPEWLITFTGILRSARSGSASSTRPSSWSQVIVGSSRLSLGRHGAQPPRDSCLTLIIEGSMAGGLLYQTDLPSFLSCIYLNFELEVIQVIHRPPIV